MPSLYENLLEPEPPAHSATISAAPVKYEFKPPGQEDEKKPDASLRFQPVKRPNAAQKPKPRPSAPPKPVPGDPKAPQPTNIDKWNTATEEDLDFAAEYTNQRSRGRRKQNKKNPRHKLGDFYADDDEYEEVDFDAIYDPAVHTNLKAYQHSEEFYRAIREWKDRLHAHEKDRLREQKRSVQEEELESTLGPRRTLPALLRRDHADSATEAFAPPASYASDPAPPLPALPTDTSGDARHAQSKMSATSFPPTTHLRPPFASDGATSLSTPPMPNSPPKPTYSATLSSAPVHYIAPDSAPDTDEPRSNRPGQRGFAQRLLSKYGWTPGTGLGATGDGITTILQHQPLKRKKRPDAEGGGWATPASMGRIVGGKKARSSAQDEKWTNIVRFRGMLRTVDAELMVAEGTLMQALGEAMEEFGVVERVRFRHAPGVDGSEVFVKFTSALSAYNAIRAVEGGRDLLGHSGAGSVEGACWGEERFEAGDLEEAETRTE